MWPPLRDVRVTNAGIAVYPPGATFGPRRLADFEFVWIIDGEAVARFDDVEVPAPAGTILLGRPGRVDRYEWAPARATTHAFFHFDCRPRPAGDWPLARQMPEHDVLRPLFRYVLSLYREEANRRLLASAVDLILRAFVSGQSRTRPEPLPALPESVARVVALIRRSAAANFPVTLASLAAEAHVSPEHLCRLFARHVGAGPLECWRLARLERAATMLGRSNLAVKEIADATGFAGPFHFSNAFKRVYAVSPKEYREQLARGVEPPAPNRLIRVLRPSVPG